jgi:hypothetical protein
MLQSSDNHGGRVEAALVKGADTGETVSSGTSAFEAHPVTSSPAIDCCSEFKDLPQHDKGCSKSSTPRILPRTMR